MKKLLYILVPALALSIVSCKKTEEPTPTPTPTTPTTPTPPSPTVSGVDAAFIGVTMTYSTTQVGIPVELNTEIALAAIYSAPFSTTGTNTMIDAGTVQVNSIALTQDASSHSYSKTATVGQTPADLGFSSGMMWNVSGANGFPAVSRNVFTSKPDFTGTVPSTVTRSSGLSFTFNSSTTPNADSVYVVLITGSTSKIWHFSGTAGTVNIPASELSSFSTTSDTNPGYIEICPWNTMWTTEGSTTAKNCVYIRERAIVKSVTVN